jgi:hypothetical protein
MALLTLAHCGCLVVAAGAAGGAALGYVYYQGQLSGRFTADFPSTWAAARIALTDLGMPIDKEEFKDGSGYLESRTAKDAKVRINLTSLPSQIPAAGPMTQVGVRVGVFGDDKASETILDQIGARLNLTGGNRVVPVPQPTQGAVQPVAAFGSPAETGPPPLASPKGPPPPEKSMPSGESPPPPATKEPVPVSSGPAPR